nr:HAD hydrolase-like protein [Reinekea sp. G2M2-21]
MLWDLDGTLIDSMPAIARCLNRTAEQYGKDPWPESRIRSRIGPELSELLAVLLDLHHSLDIADAKQSYRGFYQQQMFDSPLFDNVESVLRHFQQVGVEQYVATAKYQRYAQQIIESHQLGSLFAGVYGSDEDGRYGDKKELLAKIVKDEQLLPAQTIMIGDTVFDIEAGRHLNMTTIAVAWGYGNSEVLKKAGAHYFVERPAQLIETVKAAMTCGC